MFSISNDSLKRFTGDVCELAGERVTPVITHQLIFITRMIEHLGVGKEPDLSADDNFMQYMTCLSMSATKLLKTPLNARDDHLHNIALKAGVEYFPLLIAPPVRDRWTPSFIDSIDTGIFSGFATTTHRVYRPKSTPPANEHLYRSGNLDCPTAFRPCVKKAQSIMRSGGATVFDFANNYKSAVPYINATRRTPQRFQTGNHHDYSEHTANRKISRIIKEDPKAAKPFVKLWNARNMVNDLNHEFRKRTSSIITTALHNGTIPDATLEVPAIVSQLLIKYAPGNQVCRTKASVRLKEALMFLNCLDA